MIISAHRFAGRDLSGFGSAPQAKTAMRYILLVLCSTALLTATSRADPAPVDCRAGAPTICLIPDAEAVQALVILTLPVGSADEEEGTYGTAHYLEHLTFRGRQVEAAQTADTGAGIDGFGNAYTGAWATTYHWTVPPDRAAEAVMRAMAVLSPLDVPAEATAQEREIVARERAQTEDDPGARDRLAMNAVLHAGTPLARSVIGTPAQIAALDPVAAKAFHDRFYDPATAIVILAGAVDWTLADGLVGHGTSAARRAPALEAVPAAPIAILREDVVQRPERWAVALAPLPSGADTLAALTVANTYLASALPGAPGPALVRGRDDTRDAWVSLYEVVPGLGALASGVVLRPGLTPPDLDAPWSDLEDLREDLARHGLDAETVTRLRDRLIRDEARSRDDGIAAAWALTGWVEAGADPSDWAEWPGRLAAVTAEDVATVLRIWDAPLRKVTLDTIPRTSPGGSITPVKD